MTRPADARSEGAAADRCKWTDPCYFPDGSLAGRHVISGEQYAQFIDRVYDAAVEPTLWTGVLEQFADLVDGSGANIVAQDEITCESTGLWARSDPLAAELYLKHFVGLNPLLKTTDLPLGLRVLTDEDKLPKREFSRTAFYNDFLRRFDLDSLLIVRLALEGPRTTTITVTRPPRRERFDAREIELARYLQPHLVRAYRVASRLADGETVQAGARALLDQSALATFLLDENGRVCRVNPAGEKLIARSGSLTIRNGQLCAATSEATRRLNGLIAAARDASPEKRSGGFMAIPREQASPLSISVTPLRRAYALPSLDPQSRVLVCASDPDAGAKTSDAQLRELFALTAAEARLVAQLLEGRDLRQAAKRLGVSFYTVRGHLARIFDKLGVNRQAELVRLVTNAIGQLPAHADRHIGS